MTNEWIIDKTITCRSKIGIGLIFPILLNSVKIFRSSLTGFHNLKNEIDIIPEEMDTRN